MTYAPEHMKWWGWGDESVSFNPEKHPGAWPYARERLGIREEARDPGTPELESVLLPEQRTHSLFLAKVRSVLNPDQICGNRYERVVHAYGKGFRDLWRMRSGIAAGAPDLVAYPEKEDEVVAIIRAAAECDVVIIPFGGGSNISGCLERSDSRRMAVSLDMRRMRRLLNIDALSCTATIEAGAFGPDLEEQLNAQGMTLGHFPDSFLHSTLGGWIATRSAGMQSDKYGKIEDMVIALRMVTPEGVVATRVVPKSANGIDVNQLCIGSEGTLGVITEATLQVHPRPEVRIVLGYLFRGFEAGVEAIRECVRRECVPAMIRLNDPDKTSLSMAFKPPSSPMAQAVGKVFKSYLGAKGFDFPRACLMLIAFEGRKENVLRQSRQVRSIYKRFGAIDLGSAAGRSFEATKYDFPHIRDFLLDRSVTTDVSETSTVWSNIMPLYRVTSRAIRDKIAGTGVDPWVGCHISHTYHSGASLYFTFGFRQVPGSEMEQYLEIKRAAQQSFIDCGATLSHHHSVGTEHLPWLLDDISATGAKAVQALKVGLDPGNIMNPGRLHASPHSFEEWHRLGRELQPT